MAGGGIGGYSEPGIGDRNCGVTSTAGERVRRGDGYSGIGIAIVWV